MASLRASLLTQSTAGGGFKGACSSVPAACKNFSRVLELGERGWKPELPMCFRGASTTSGSRNKVLHHSSSSTGHLRPGFSSNFMFAVDPSVSLLREESTPIVQFLHHQQQSQCLNLVVAVVRPPLETSPDVRPSLNPFSPDIPDPNLPTPPTTTPPDFSPDESPSEFPAPSTNPEPEVVPSVPQEVPVTEPVPEFSPTTIPTPEIPSSPSEFPSVPSESPVPSIPIEIPLVSPREIPVTPTPTELPGPGGPPEFRPMMGNFSSSEVEGSGVPRGPPIMPPNTPPILPPGTPLPIPPPNLSPIPPPGTPPSIPPPNTPPIPPGMPGPVPPPTPPPGSPPPFPGAEIPSVPPLGPEIPNPPSIIGA